MTDLLLDYETYCDLDLKKVGVKKYVTHPSFKVLCMYYLEFDPKTLECGPTKGWNFFEPKDCSLSGFDHYWAFNTGFDFSVYLHAAFEGITLSSNPGQWRDIQVLLSKFSFPQSLNLRS